MAWTSPLTAVANSTFPAAQFNTHVRDNLNETAPAKATTQSRLLVTTGLNSIAERDLDAQLVAASETTISDLYTDLTTVGPTVTITTGPRAIVILTAQLENDTSGSSSLMSFEISGATARSAADDDSLQLEAGAANQHARMSAMIFATALTPGSNTFSAKYRVTSGQGSFRRRQLFVMAL